MALPQEAVLQWRKRENDIRSIKTIIIHSYYVEETRRIVPTRLLRFKDGHLKLCSGRNLDISTRYISLSHC
jgi:hypothetical protein